MINPMGSGAGQVADAQREQLAKTRQAALGAAASLFDMSPGELQAELGSGKSLSDVAADKGVSQDDLRKTIQAAVAQVNPNASDNQIANLVQRAASGHHHGHHHHQAPPPADAGSTSSLPADSTISVKA
jgi:hypothetical protein